MAENKVDYLDHPILGRVILGSGSQARRKIFTSHFQSFEVVKVEAKEFNPQYGHRVEVALNNAQTKMLSLIETLNSLAPKKGGEPFHGNSEVGAHECPKGTSWVAFTADTVVSIAHHDGSDEFFYKPIDRQDAKRIILSIMGKNQNVTTGVCVAVCENARIVEARLFVDEGVCAIDTLDEREVESYLDTGLWQGCSGAFQLSPSCPARLVSGSYETVEGFIPFDKLARSFVRTIDII